MYPSKRACDHLFTFFIAFYEFIGKGTHFTIHIRAEEYLIISEEFQNLRRAIILKASRCIYDRANFETVIALRYLFDPHIGG